MKTTPDMFAKATKELFVTLVEKNLEYEDVYAWDGLNGVFSDLQGKYVRLKHLIITEHGKNVTAIRDAFKDLAGYGLLGMNLCDHPEIAEAVKQALAREEGKQDVMGPEIFKGFKQDGQP